VLIFVQEAYEMENIIAVIAVAVFLAGILLIAKEFLKPPKGPLPDCCGPSSRLHL
jgi:hypothetical protein